MTAQRRPSPAQRRPQQPMEVPPSPNQKPRRRPKDPTTPSADSRDQPPLPASSAKRRPSDEASHPPELSPRSPSPPPPQALPKFNMDDVKYYLSKKLRFLHTDERHVLIAVCVAHLKAPGNRQKDAVKTSLSPFVGDPELFIDKMWKYIRAQPEPRLPPAPPNTQNGRDNPHAQSRASSDASVSDGRSRLHRRRPTRTNRSRSVSSSSMRRYARQESRERRKHERRSRRRRKRADRDRRVDRRYGAESDSEDDDRGRRPRKRRRRHRYSDEESDRERYYGERDSRRYAPPMSRYPNGRHPEERDRSPPPAHRRPDHRYGERLDRSPYGRPPDRRNLDDRDRDRDRDRDHDRSPIRHERMERPRDLRNELSRRPRDEEGATRRGYDGGARYSATVPSPRGPRSAVDDDKKRNFEAAADGDEVEPKPSPPPGPGSSLDSKGQEATTKLQHLRSKALASLKKTPSLK